jgi:endonuclease/exonuclease/phosphatase family metal-dependent hydrolase
MNIQTIGILPAVLIACACATTTVDTFTVSPVEEDGAVYEPGDWVNDGPGIRLNIMTFNVKNAINENTGKYLGTNTIRYWPYRSDACAQVLLDEDIDIAGMQETELVQIKDFMARMPGYSYIGVGRDDGKTGGQYVSIFYKKARFKIIEWGTYWLSETPEVPGKKGWDAGTVRLATWVVFEERGTGKQFFMVNTHLDNSGSKARVEGAKLIMQRSQEKYRGLPMILTGDFNDTPDGTAVKYFSNASNPIPLVHTRDTAQVTEGPRGTGHDWGAKTLTARFIDYIFVSPGSEVFLHRVEPAEYKGFYLSDHSPVMARIRLQ